MRASAEGGLLQAVLTLTGEGVHGTPYSPGCPKVAGGSGKRSPRSLPMVPGGGTHHRQAATCRCHPAYAGLVRLLLILLPALLPVSASADSPTAPAVRYVIVVTGGELLTGAYPDGHTVFLTRTLRPLGLQCVGSLCIDDKQADIKEALGFAAGKASLILVTGGLGPTDNDVTREALGDFTGIELREHPDVLAAMARRFNTSADKLRSNLRRQARTPTQGTYLQNANGTAVGLVFEARERVIVALPGPPRELQAMVQEELVPYLSRHFGTRLPGASLTLRFVGLGQSQIDQTLKEHVPLPADVTTSSQFDGSRVDFTFSLPNDTPEDRTRLQELKARIIQYLGDNLYADDETTSLEDCVVRLLATRGQTLALAEIGSGGALAAALNGAQDAPRVLAGAHVAPTPERLRHLLGLRETASDGSTSALPAIQEFAHATAAEADSSWALAVGEVRRGDAGPVLEIAFRWPDGRLESRSLRAPGTDTSGRARLMTELLDQLRRRLRQGAGNDR